MPEVRLVEGVGGEEFFRRCAEDRHVLLSESGGSAEVEELWCWLE